MRPVESSTTNRYGVIARNKWIALGRCPIPREGLCPLDPHQGWALDAICWVREERGPTRTLKRHGRPPFLPGTINGIQGPALVGVEGAKPLAGFGAEPQGFLSLPRLPRQMKQ